MRSEILEFKLRPHLTYTHHRTTPPILFFQNVNMRREDELCKDVVFAIIRRYDYGQKKYLIARRDMEKNLGGLYELPGGKVSLFYSPSLSSFVAFH